MLDRFCRKMRIKSVARKYARLLGPRLQADYGASEHYTSEQIKESALRAKLPADYIWFGYAGFMSEDAFQKLPLHSATYSYEEIRTILQSYKHRSVSSRFDPASENQYAVGGFNDPTSHLD